MPSSGIKQRLSWLYNALQYEDPALPTRVSDAPIVAGIDALQGGWAFSNYLLGTFGQAASLAALDQPLITPGAWSDTAVAVGPFNNTRAAVLLGATFTNVAAGAKSFGLYLLQPGDTPATAAAANRKMFLTWLSVAANTTIGSAQLLGSAWAWVYVPRLWSLYCTLPATGVGESNFMTYNWAQVPEGAKFI